MGRKAKPERIGNERVGGSAVPRARQTFAVMASLLAAVRLMTLVGAALCAAAAGAETPTLTEIRKLAAEKRFDAALERLEVLLGSSPGQVEARLFKGVVLTRMGRTADAIETFLDLSEDFPALPEPHNNLAVLYAAEHRYDDARSALLRALELQPRYDTAHENLGDVYAKLAAVAYERAYQLNRTNERAREKSGRVSAVLLVEAPGPGAGANPVVPLLPEREASAEPSRVLAGEGSPPRTPGSCLTAGPMGREQAEAVVDWAGAHALAAAARSAKERTRIGFRVSLPPLESRAAAEVQVTQLRNEGIEDIVRLADNAIALGVYTTRESAERRAQRFESMGYQPEITERLVARDVWHVDLQPGGAETAAALERAFPGLAGAPADRCGPAD